MAAGTSPIFLATPRISGISTGLNANTGFDGAGSNVNIVFTAGANGSKVEQISFVHTGTNVATAVRIFVNNGLTPTTGTNNNLVLEVTMAANTASQVAASVPVTAYPNIILPAGYRILATIGTAIASGIMVTCQGGDY